jgi:hypothetical protein
MFLGIKLEGWLTIAAIILGPVLAFAIQQWRDRLRDDLKRKRAIFQQLLLTLKAPMAPNHVNAINSIPLEFYSDGGVFQAWREYVSHLNNIPMLKQLPAQWTEKKSGLLINLAYEIGKCLGYKHLDKAALKDNVYTPQGYEDREEESRKIRESCLQVLKGQHPIPVTMVGPIQVEEPLKPIEEITTPQRPVLPPPTDGR